MFQGSFKLSREGVMQSIIKDAYHRLPAVL
jgi:hypothetical protein